MIRNWQLLAPGDYFTLPNREHHTGKAVIYRVMKIEQPWVHYRSEHDGTNETCTLGWLIDNGLDLF